MAALKFSQNQVVETDWNVLLENPNSRHPCELVVVGTLTGIGNLARNSHVGFVWYKSCQV
jgi:hypothetical protein